MTSIPKKTEQRNSESPNGPVDSIPESHRSLDPKSCQDTVLAGLMKQEEAEDYLKSAKEKGLSLFHFSSNVQPIYVALVSLIESDKFLSPLAVKSQLSESELESIGGDYGVEKYANMPLDYIQFYEAVEVLIDDRNEALKKQKGATAAIQVYEGKLDEAIQTIEDIRNLGADTEAQSETQRFVGLTLSDLRELPDTEWLIDNIIAPGDLAMIFGLEGTGKTYITIDMIMSALTAQKWAGNFAIDRPITIAYASDEGRRGLKPRFLNAAAQYGVDIDNDEGLRIFLEMPMLFIENSEDYITKFISDYQSNYGSELDLLVLDTLSNAAVGSNENDSGDAGIVVSAIKRARDALGCATLMLHHPDKGDNAPRGSGKYAGDMDLIIKTTSKKNPHKMALWKAKDADPFNGQGYEIEKVNEVLRLKWTGDMTDSVITENVILNEMGNQPDTRLTAKQWAELSTRPDKPITTSNALNQLNRLADNLEIQRILTDIKKVGSKVNPLLFWYESPF